jgi:hypothetical protein
VSAGDAGCVDGCGGVVVVVLVAGAVAVEYRTTTGDGCDEVTAEVR